MISTGPTDMGDTVQRHQRVVPLLCRQNKRPTRDRGPQLYDQPLAEH